MSLNKLKKQIDKLIEKVTVDPPHEPAGDPKDISTLPSVSITVDTSDQLFSLKSASKHENKDTVFGQGTPPDPRDETYLSLLKGTSMGKAKIKIKEEDDEERDEIEIRVNRNPTQPNPDLNPSYYGGPKPK